MMTKHYFLVSLAWRNLWRTPRRTFVTLAVVLVGLYSILVLGSLLQAWAESSRDANLKLLTGSGQIHATGYLDDPSVHHRMPAADQALTSVLDSPDIQSWVSRVRVPAVIQSEYKTLPLTLLGVDPQGERSISTIPDRVVSGHYLTAKDDTGIVLGQHLAHRLKTEIGKRIVILTQAEDGSLTERAFKVIGLYSKSESFEDSYSFVAISTAQKMLNIGSDISEISFVVADEQQLSPVIDLLQQAESSRQVSSWQTLSPLTAAINGFMQSFVYIWLWIMFIFIAIGIINTQLMAVFERIREFGMLVALGMKPRLILTLVMLESLLLIGIGVLLGMTCAGLTILLVHNGIDLSFMAAGAEYWGGGQVLYPKMSLFQFTSISLTVWIVGTMVALWPARKAAKSDPVEAMRHV